MDAVDQVLAPHSAPAARAAGESCDPKLCTFADREHAHCLCGMPMPRGTALCGLCVAEGLDPIESGPPELGDNPLAWDGLSYPSRRRRRIHVEEHEFHLQLAERILQPAVDEELLAPAIVRRRRSAR